MNIHNGRIGIGSGAFFYAYAVRQALGIADGVSLRLILWQWREPAVLHGLGRFL